MEDMTLRIECAGHTTVNIDELIELHHYGKITDEHYAHARNSLTELGFSFPFFYWEQDGKKYTVDGHSRLKVIKRMRDEGFTIPSLPADPIFAKDRAEAKKKILAQESRYKDFDEGLFTEFLAEDNLIMEDLENFVDIPGLDTELWEGKEDVVEDEAPAVNESEPAISQLGQVYQLGKHRLMCGDSTKIEDVEKLMNGQKADMVFTDPPYGVDYSSRVDEERRKGWGGIKNDDLKGEELQAFLQDSLAYFDCDKYICCNWQSVIDFWRAYGKLNAFIVWDKGSIGLGAGYRNQHEIILFYGTLDHNSESNIWAIKRDNTSEYIHPTQKPVAIPARAIKNSSKDGSIIVDIFGGSGSTLIACEQTNRTCYMMELDPKYCDVIRKRYQKFVTGSEEGWQEATPCIA